jgi:hypothetical protein
MPLNATPDHARRSLRQLTTPQTLEFCRRLLKRSNEGSLGFREFVATAHELVIEKPEDSALLLAGMVALDMGSDELNNTACSHEISNN